MASVHKAMRERHYATATEEAYTKWIRRFIEFNGTIHPIELEATHLQAFLDALACEQKVSESTHNQALCAIVFLYRVVLSANVPWVEGLVRPKHIEHIPVVLSRDEARRVLDQLNGVERLVASLLYGSGLRLIECMRLRIKDLDFDGSQILVRRGKGKKDRVTLFPFAIREPLRRHLVQVRKQHEHDLQTGGGYVYIPDALRTKSPNAPRHWRWHWLFQDHPGAPRPLRHQNDDDIHPCPQPRADGSSQSPRLEQPTTVDETIRTSTGRFIWNMVPA